MLPVGSPKVCGGRVAVETISLYTLKTTACKVWSHFDNNKTHLTYLKFEKLSDLTKMVFMGLKFE